MAGRSYGCVMLASMAFTIFHAFRARLGAAWGHETGRTIARLSGSLTQSRANVWRYPPGARGKRHADRAQEEVFFFLDGMLTVDLGEPPERHELACSGVSPPAPDSGGPIRRCPYTATPEQRR